MVRICKVCNTEKDLQTGFVKTGKGGYYKHTCKECIKPSQFARNLKAKYKMTLDQFNAMFAAQGSQCLLCKTPESERWCVDHDHNCCPTKGGYIKTCGECVRGILCNDCNLGLGNFKDNPDALLEAYAYLMGSKVKAGVKA